jgi:hypothetical protein
MVRISWGDSRAELTATRLCVETPRAGWRIFETGDERLLQLAQKIQSAFLAIALVMRLKMMNLYMHSSCRNCLYKV